jgi:transcription antitermination factor NusG
MLRATALQNEKAALDVGFWHLMSFPPLIERSAIEVGPLSHCLSSARSHTCCGIKCRFAIRLSGKKGVDFWVVAMTRPSCERRAREALTIHGFEPYYPLYVNPSEVYRGKLPGQEGYVERRRPYFPGYVFYRYTPAWRDARATDWLREYVKRILISAGYRPTLINSEQIENLQAIERDGAIRPLEKKPRRFAVGALVRVTKGPFEGMVGTVEVEIKRSTKVVSDFGILQ